MKIMKRVTALVLAALLLVTPALAATATQQNTAAALNALGLLQGTGGPEGYALDWTLKRADGITLLVRLMGKEAEAKSGKYSHPFDDVAGWLAGYVAYAYEKGITKGGENGKFLGNELMSDYMFLTLVLRALGYSDSGENAQFTWRNPYPLARQLGLITYSSEDKEFTRGDAVMIFWAALSVKLNGTDRQLQQELINQGVFTAAQFRAAVQIQQSGAGNSGNNGNPGNSGNNGGEGNPLDNYTYEDYLALTPAEQEALYETYFGSAHALEFIQWLNKLKEEYDARQNGVDIGNGGNVDIGDLIGGGNG